MLHDRSLRKGRDRSLTIERDRVRTHGMVRGERLGRNGHLTMAAIPAG